MAKFKKVKFILIFLVLFFCPVFISSVKAGTLLKDIGSRLNPFADTYGASSTTEATTIADVVASIIQYALSFLGVVFLVLLIYGGFLWMTARGDEEQINKAKDILQNVIIGIIIILSSYVLTYFILKNLTKATATYY